MYVFNNRLEISIARLCTYVYCLRVPLETGEKQCGDEVILVGADFR